MKIIHLIVFLPGMHFFACDQKSKTTNSDFAKEVNTLKSPVNVQNKKQYIIDGIYFDNRFDGARMNDVKKKNDSTYTITILPENEPVNQSPWYAFKIHAKAPTDICIELDYRKFNHRYIPKISRNGEMWRSINANIRLNRDSTKASFQVQLSADTLWIASQEVVFSDNMYSWINSVISIQNFLKKEVAGKTVLNNDIYVISSEHKETRPSVVLIARQHPPEVPGGTIAFKAFFNELISESVLAISFRKNFNLYVFPLLNPDGVDLGNWRHNANGADLNRDWVDFYQPETRVARDYISEKVQTENKTISFGIDFHTSYSGPYLLILDSLNEQSAKTRIIPEWIKRTHNDPALTMEYRRRSQELPYCYNWFFKEYGAEAVTYEDGDEIDRRIIKKRARLYATKLMETLIEKYHSKDLLKKTKHED